jgi:hypothetical protein
MSVSATPSDVRFVAVSLDCADPAELAEFYLQMLGGRLLWSRPTVPREVVCFRGGILDV